MEFIHNPFNNNEKAPIYFFLDNSINGKQEEKEVLNMLVFLKQNEKTPIFDRMMFLIRREIGNYPAMLILKTFMGKIDKNNPRIPRFSYYSTTDDMRIVLTSFRKIEELLPALKEEYRLYKRSKEK